MGEKRSNAVWFVAGGAGVVVLIAAVACCGVLGWLASFAPPGDPAIAKRVQVTVDGNIGGFECTIRNNTGVALSSVSLVVKVFPDGRSTPVLNRVYEVNPIGGIESGETVKCQVMWRNDDSNTMSLLVGDRVFQVTVCGLHDANGDVLYYGPR